MTKLEGTPDLAAIVHDYLSRFEPRRRKEEKRFRDVKDLEAAVREAALAWREDGKCQAHQRRVGIVRLRLFEKQLQRVRADIAACTSFDELHGLIRDNRTARIGALTVYDTALRIGYYLRLIPKSVYLHAGTRGGAQALGLPTKGGVLPMDMLPPPLRRLSADQAEDCLCIYKSEFGGRGGRGNNSAHGCSNGRGRNIC